MGWLSHHTWDFLRASTPLHTAVPKWVLFQQASQKTPESTAVITALIYAREEARQIVLFQLTLSYTLMWDTHHNQMQ